MAKRKRRNAFARILILSGCVGLAGIASAGVGLLAMRNGWLAGPGFMICLLVAQILFGVALLILLAGGILALSR